MHAYLVLMSLALGYSLLSLQAGLSSPSHPPHPLCPLSSAQAEVSRGESFPFEGTVSSLSLGDSGVAERHMPQTCDLRRHPVHPPFRSIHPASFRRATIKAELIKPQLIASAGGSMRRKKGGRRGGGGVQLHTGIYQPFSTYRARLAAASHCTHSPVVLSHAAVLQSLLGSARLAFLRASFEGSATGEGGESQRWSHCAFE